MHLGIEKIIKNHWEQMVDGNYLHQKSHVTNFNIRLNKPLYKYDIEKIIRLS